MFEDYVVLYGGSFNPPSVAHQAVCMWAAQALNSKAVMVVPTFEHNLGKQLSYFSHRTAMCELMVAAFREEIVVSTIEQALPKPNTTYGLLKYFNTIYDKLAILIGSELLGEITQWYKWEELPKLAKIIVANRPGFPKVKAPFEVTEFPIELPSTSSSEIRNRLAAGQSIDGLVPCSIKDYIYTNGLYGAK